MNRNSLFTLEGKVVVVTGGSGYLGEAIVTQLAAFGAQTVVADREECPAVQQSFGEQVVWMPCDVAATESVRFVMQRTEQLFGKLDVLIHCAAFGAGFGLEGAVERMSDEDWETGLSGTAGTAFRCTREAIPMLRRNGAGSIVHLASMYGVVSPDPRIYGSSGANSPANYGAGKAAVLQFTRYCAAHLAQYNIRVNSVTPGPFPRPEYQTDAEFKRELERKTMLGRVGTSGEIAGAVILLASDASSYMTGSNITVDGGWTAW